MSWTQDQSSFDHIAGVSLIAGNGGMPAVRVSRGALKGELYLHGGHVTSWKPPHAEEVLFLSEHAVWNYTKAIRGGVPICFPWFGPKSDQPAAPQHGFARTREWTLEKIAEEAGGVRIDVSDRSDERSREYWPFDYALTHRVAFGDTLKMELVAQNTGKEPFLFEEAQHSYFRIGNVQEVAIDELHNRYFLDKTDGKTKKQHGKITLQGETDRIYFDTADNISIIDTVLRRCITITRKNSRSAVIWNPWIEKARALSDLGDDEWQKMVCIETCNIRNNVVRLSPGESHVMGTEISVRSI
jgi:glucose-6-phosphate 1-epimerase